MQQDMQCDVTCCTVTSPSHLGILCLASGRSEDTLFTDKSMEQHQLLIQRSEVGSLLFLLQQQQRLGKSRDPLGVPIIDVLPEGSRRCELLRLMPIRRNHIYKRCPDPSRARGRS